MSNDIVLSKIEGARLLLWEAKNIPDTKKVLDIAVSAEIFAKRQKLSEESIQIATDLKMEALRQLGSMLKETLRNTAEYRKGGGSKGSKKELILDAPLTLAELGLDKKTSSLAQQIASLSDEQFESVKMGVTIKEIQKQRKDEQKYQDREKIAQLGKKVKSSDLWNVIYGDVREVGNQIQDNSIDLILTDPPYPEEFLYCWDALADLAQRVLKPSGFLISYSGQFYLPIVMSKLSSKLEYYWTTCLKHEGVNQLIMGRNVFCGWKPILIYQKSPFKRFDGHFSDVIVGSGREKGLHDWQQAEDELGYLIDTFTVEGQTILDPFAGSGTTLVASIIRKRFAFGIEIDETNFNISRSRLDDATKR